MNFFYLLKETSWEEFRDKFKKLVNTLNKKPTENAKNAAINVRLILSGLALVNTNELLYNLCQNKLKTENLSLGEYG